jgi:hypothetical protein
MRGKVECFGIGQGASCGRKSCADCKRSCPQGQELREMTRDLNLREVDVDMIAIIIRFRGASAPTGGNKGIIESSDQIAGESYH